MLPTTPEGQIQELFSDADLPPFTYLTSLTSGRQNGEFETAAWGLTVKLLMGLVRDALQSPVAPPMTAERRAAALDAAKSCALALEDATGTVVGAAQVLVDEELVDDGAPPLADGVALRRCWQEQEAPGADWAQVVVDVMMLLRDILRSSARPAFSSDTHKALMEAATQCVSSLSPGGPAGPADGVRDGAATSAGGAALGSEIDHLRGRIAALEDENRALKSKNVSLEAEVARLTAEVGLPARRSSSFRGKAGTKGRERTTIEGALDTVHHGLSWAERNERDGGVDFKLLTALLLAAKAAPAQLRIDVEQAKSRAEVTAALNENPDDISRLFQAKFQFNHEANVAAVKATEAALAGIERRFDDVTPGIAERASAQTIAAEVGYTKAYETRVAGEAGATGRLAAAVERIGNVGRFAKDGALVFVKARTVGCYSGRHVVPDREGGDFILGIVEEVNGDDVTVRLWEEKTGRSSGEWESAGHTARWTVPRAAIYGGQPELRQPLPDGVDPLSPLALAWVYADAEAAKPILDAMVNAAVDAVKAAEAASDRGSGGDGVVVVSPLELKEALRAAAKALEKYGGNFARVLDVARLTVVCDTLGQVAAVIEELGKTEGVVARIKNRLDEAFDTGPSAGYRDVLLNVWVEIGGGRRHVCEVQVTLSELLEAKRTGGHGGYSVFRVMGGDQTESTTHVGALDARSAGRVAAGLLRRLVLEGTTLGPEQLAWLSGSGEGRGCLLSPSIRLRSLQLGGCGGLKGTPLADVLPDEACAALGGMLRVLDVSGTGVTGQVPRGLFEHCTRLTELVLNDNEGLCGDLVGVSRLAHLRVLHIHCSGFEGSAGEFLGEVVQCPQLRSLRCIITGFKGGQAPSSLWGLVQLDVLDLAHMGLDIVVTPAAHQLKRLCFIRLYDNNITYDSTTEEETIAAILAGLPRQPPRRLVAILAGLPRQPPRRLVRDDGLAGSGGVEIVHDPN